MQTIRNKAQKISNRLPAKFTKKARTLKKKKTVKFSKVIITKNMTENTTENRSLQQINIIKVTNCNNFQMI